MATRCEPYPTGEDPVSACQQSLVAGKGISFRKSTSTEIRRKFEHYEEQISVLLSDGVMVGDEWAEEEKACMKLHDEGTVAYANAMEEAVADRVFFITVDQYMGLASVGCLPGDWHVSF